MIKILLILISLFFFSNSDVFANNNVLINEILADPQSGQGEWVELYSSSSQFDLAGWYFQDKAGSKKTLNNVEICGNFAVYQYSSDGWLNNTGKESIYLFDKNNTGVDSLIDFTNPGEGKTLGRIPDGLSNWQTLDTSSRCSSNGSTQTEPSGQQPSSISTSSIQPVLSEFMPNPQEGNEWVELFNPENSNIDITGYKIDDIEGGSSPFTIPQGTILGGQSYLYFSFSARLNNDGDTVRLLDPSGKVLEEYSYKETIKGVSFAKDSSFSWSQTETPTPGAKNLISTPKEDDGKKASKREASQVKDGQSVAKSAGEGAKTGGISKSGQAEEGTSESPDSTPSLSLESSPTPAESSPAAITQGFGQRRLVFILLILGGLLIMLAGVRLWYKKRLK